MTDNESTGELLVSTAAGTLLGPRTRNNDRVVVTPDALVVVDGAGDGEGAGKVADAAMAGALTALAETPGGEAERARLVVAAAAVTVEQIARGVGAATMTALCLSGGMQPRVDLAWVGDSPAYLVRDDQLWQLTRAHNRAQELAERRVFDLNDVALSPLAAHLTRALGTSATDAETHQVHLQGGDRLLVATDGIQVLGPEAIAWCLASGADARAAVEEILGLATERGLNDNLAVAVAVIGVSRDLAASTLASREDAPPAPASGQERMPDEVTTPLPDF